VLVARILEGILQCWREVVGGGGSGGGSDGGGVRTLRIVEWRRFRRCAAAACSATLLWVGAWTGGARCMLASRNANISSFVLNRGYNRCAM